MIKITQLTEKGFNVKGSQLQKPSGCVIHREMFQDWSPVFYVYSNYVCLRTSFLAVSTSDERKYTKSRFRKHLGSNLTTNITKFCFLSYMFLLLSCLNTFNIFIFCCIQFLFHLFRRHIDAVGFPAKKLSAARLEAQLIYMTISRNVVQGKKKPLCLF